MTVLELFKLDGQLAIVTGGAQSLGRQHALALAEAGANVAICDLNEDAGRATEAELRALGRCAWFARVDVTRVDQVEAFINEVTSRLGPVDILVNNAGIRSEGVALHEVSDERWQEIVNANLSSLFYFGKRVAQQMIQRGKGGKIINVASINSFVIGNTFPRHNVVYCVAKAGVAHLTRGMASEWAQYGIRVNAIAPGFMHTPMTAPHLKQPEIYERHLACTPLKRYGNVDELKGAVVFLASDASSFATGSVVVVDGGYTVY